MILQIIVPIYRKFPNKKSKQGFSNTVLGMNWYRNAHFQVLNKVKAEYNTLIISELTKYEITPFHKVHIHYKIYCKNNKTDGGNVRSVIEKFVLDALIKSNLLKDDCIKYIMSDSSEYFVDKNKPRCEIIIKKST